ncbi:hypothetical protein [Naasia lichenicola]|uniref:Uncharacterized protein n=1 Tax=Naasia lichenicola TaxID=2565933 RepID=A0A4S4FP12_9MICO|nr:hypothetical protein [Naasia lichenicola]THG30744.1 hypothetical protein E6C64_08885 [Naasia lichenicola]THG31981.1 hypothetical protein E6C64_08030 [Naasia lichenicola]
MVSVLKKALFWLAATALCAGILAFALASATSGYPGSSATTDFEYGLSRILIPGAFIGFIGWLMLSALMEADLHAQERRSAFSLEA